jgi:hypothetical protein
MFDHETNGPYVGLSAQITRAVGQLWTRYAGVAPSAVRTELNGDVVTCVLVDAVDAFEKRTTAAPGRGREAKPSDADLSLGHYKTEAIAAITRLTRQRVSAFLSSHDRDTDVATEVFELDPSLGYRGLPARERRARLSAAPAPPPRVATR